MHMQARAHHTRTDAHTHTTHNTRTHTHTTRLHGHAQVAALSLEQRKLSAQLAAGGGAGGGYGGVGTLTEDALAALEKRMTDRQARIEGALMQVGWVCNVVCEGAS